MGQTLPMVRGLRLGTVGLLLLASCASDTAGPEGAPVAPAPSSFSVQVAHHDARLGVPTFAWVTHRGTSSWTTPLEAAEATILAAAPSLSLGQEALRALGAFEIHDTGRGPIVARATARVGGTEIFRAGLNVLMTRSFEPIAVSGFLREAPTSPPSFVLREEEALARAMKAMGAADTTLRRRDVRGDYHRFDAASLRTPARVKRVLFPVRASLVAGYYVELMLRRGDARSFVLDAATGEVLFQNELVRNDAFSYRVYGSSKTLLPDDGPQGNNVAPHPSGRPDGFRPTWRSSSLVTLANYPFSKNDPWLSPTATTTQGNNVDAYADLASGDGYTEGKDVRPALSSPKVFDVAYDTASPPLTSVSAATTHLFYVTNFLHDWYYDAGFDERSGNHQRDNFGRGGQDGDELLAEAQDFSGRNNANAATPADGASPRIQMFVFSGESNAYLDVTGPANVAGRKRVGLAAFGVDSFETTAPLVLADDAQGTDARDACESLGSEVAGKVVLVHRGLCSFVQKIQNVQTAGGVGVLVANVSSSVSPADPPYMGGTSSGITIPALSLALADGAALEAAVASGVTVTMKRALQTDLDGALDTTIVAHEWGHVLSNRLVGDANGLTTNQAVGLGEGWGDFSAMMVMVRPEDIDFPSGAGWRGAYPNGAYATSGGGADFYYGIRRVPYSIDFAKDPLTFKHIENGVPLPTDVPVSFGEDGSFNAEVHNTGEVWATMLWECYAALLQRLPFTEAQERMKRYLVTSLKMTPIDPTLLEARDAVLAAAYAGDREDFDAFWRAFARRGAGVGALGPGKDSGDNGGVVESQLTGNGIEVSNAILLDDVISCDHDARLDEGEVGTLTVTVRNTGSGTLASPQVRLSSKEATLVLPDGESFPVGALEPFESRIVKIQVGVRKAAPNGPIGIDIVGSDPSLTEDRFSRMTLATRYDTDEVAQTSAIDTVDTAKTAWRVTGGRGNGGQPWSRVFDGQNGRWYVPDIPVVGSTTLTSPSFAIEGQSFGLSFTHRFSFRFSARRQVDVDGGVIEVSLDEGKTWEDASVYGAVDYTTKLDDSARTDNPLKGRAAYGNKSTGYPDAWTKSSVVLTFPTPPPGQIQVRFRAAMANGIAGAPGWEIDDIALSGVISTPFWSFLPHGDFCDVKGPTATASGGGTFVAGSTVTLSATGTSTSGEPVTFTWAQAAGDDIALQPSSPASVSFVAPDVAVPTVMSFNVRAVDGALLSPASKVDVTVVPASSVAVPLAAGGGCSTAPRTKRAEGELGAFGMAAILSALGLRRRRRGSALR